MSKYGVISGPYFPVFSPNTGKYGPEKTLCLGTFHAFFTPGLVIIENSKICDILFIAKEIVKIYEKYVLFGSKCPAWC